MTFKLSKRSLSNLEGVHPDLVDVVKRAIEITPVDFTVIEGLRTEARQKKLFAEGASKTLNSRHLTGHAVDIVPFIDGDISWHWPHYYPLAEAMKDAADELGVDIEWGGDWKRFKDGPHWQLPWNKYGKLDRHSLRDKTPTPPDVEPIDEPPGSPWGDFFNAIFQAIRGIFR